MKNMGFYSTPICFFTAKNVESNNEFDQGFIDGYCYQIKFNNHLRTIKLSLACDWKNDKWMQVYSIELLNLIDKYEEWSFFDRGKTLSDVKSKYNELKRKENK